MTYLKKIDTHSHALDACLCFFVNECFFVGVKCGALCPLYNMLFNCQMSLMADTQSIKYIANNMVQENMAIASI